MISVERVIHFAELPQQAPQRIPNSFPPSWPEKGRIIFKDVSLRYREGLDLVLKGILYKENKQKKIDFFKNFFFF